MPAHALPELDRTGLHPSLAMAGVSARIRELSIFYLYIILGSKKMGEFLENLGAKADIVIIDGPPFIVADAPLLASKVDGVLLIVRLGHTREPAIKSMMEQIERAGAKVIGVALNRLPASSVGSYTGNPDYSPYFSQDEEGFGSPSFPRSWREKLSFWPFNNQSSPEPETGSRSVFDDIDMIDGESDGYGWRDS